MFICSGEQCSPIEPIVKSVRQYKHFILIYYLLRYKNAIVAHLFWFCNQNKWQSLIAATDSIVTFIKGTMGGYVGLFNLHMLSSGIQQTITNFFITVS